VSPLGGVGWFKYIILVRWDEVHVSFTAGALLWGMFLKAVGGIMLVGWDVCGRSEC
jgi:hypothetical protein